MKRKLVVTFILLLFIFPLVLSQNIGQISSFSSSTFISSNIQVSEPSVNIHYQEIQFNEYQNICVDRKDFIIQVAPAGCTPRVVRSDLLAEQPVPVFCQLQAIQVNPTIDVSRIRNIRLIPVGEKPEGVLDVGFQRANAALSFRRNTDTNFATVENIGYAVIILDQQPNEDLQPEEIIGQLSARIEYDISKGFGLGLQDKALPVLDEDEWQRDFQQYSFFEGKAFARLENVQTEGIKIGIYADANRKISSVSIPRGGTSNELYLPGFTCDAAYSITYTGSQLPGPKAILEIENDQYDVFNGNKFAEHFNCRVKNILPGAYGSGTVNLECNGQPIVLSLKRNSMLLNLDGNGPKLYDLGDEVSDGKYLVYSGITKDGVEFVITYSDRKLNADLEAIAKSWESKNKAEITDGEKALIDAAGFYFKNEETGEEKTILSKDPEESRPGFNEIVEEFKYISDNYGDIEIPKDLESILLRKETYGEIALFKAIELAINLGEQDTCVELKEELFENYGESSIVGLDCSLNFDTSGAIRSFTIDGQPYSIRLLRIDVPDKDDKRFEFNIDDKKYTVFDKNQEIYNKSGNRIILTKFTERALTVEGTCSKQKETKQTATIQEGGRASICGKNVIVTNIHLLKLAKIKLNPMNHNTGSEVEFSYGIGIEQRAIKLNPEKSLEKIKRLNEDIEKWNNVNDNLEGAVEGLKAACFATSAALQVKNLFGNLGGKALARNNAMESWHEYCDANPGDYNSKDDCFRQNSEAIEADVELQLKHIEVLNKQIEDIEAGVDKDGKPIRHDGGFLQNDVVNTEAANQAFISNVLQGGDKYKGLKLADFSKAKGDSFEDVSVFIEGLKADDLRYLQSRDVQLHLNVWQDPEASSRMQNQSRDKLYSTLSEVRKRQSYTVSESKATEAAKGFKDTGVSYISRPLPRGGSTFYYDGAVTSGVKQDLGKEGDEHFAFVSGERGEIYIITLTNIDGENFGLKDVYTVDGWLLSKDEASPTDHAIDKEIRRAYRGKFIKLDAGSYNNGYIRPQVIYHERAPMKGRPAVVPLDLKKGWYAGTKNDVPLLGAGHQQSFQDSGLTQSFWLCNVGDGGKEEFSSTSFGNDICQKFNLNAAQPPKFAGLEETEVRELVRKAENALREAASKYKQGIKTVSISGVGRNIEVGNPAPSLPGTSCADFMSPKECQLMFNVCDPVICPSSRCNLGGNYYVEDVVSTGIVGSALLCLPNAQEGIAIPVCLTGINAGIEAYASVLEAHRDCLQEHVDTGRYVGICDEVTAIRQCEFFWNQVAPLTSTLLPNILGKTKGGDVPRGGGEYLNVAGAWTNMKNSMNFFTDKYAVNSLTAYRQRSTREVGIDVCKAFVSSSFPTDFKTLIEADSPTQFTGWFDEIPMSSAVVPAQSQYKVFYHIFAGDDQGVFFTVYLKNAPGTSFFQSSGIQTVDTGFIPKGEYADEARDLTSVAGFKELCIRINNQEKCGFQKVSTNFAINYARDQFIENQLTEQNIASEKDCISGTPSALGLINPNLQSGIQDAAIDPQIYQSGIIRVCATANPGDQINPEQWKEVGYCDDQRIKCWLDKGSIDRALSVGNNITRQTTIEELDLMAENLGKKQDLAKQYLKKLVKWYLEIINNGLIDAESLESFDEPKTDLPLNSDQATETWVYTDIAARIYWNEVTMDWEAEDVKEAEVKEKLPAETGAEPIAESEALSDALDNTKYTLCKEVSKEVVELSEDMGVEYEMIMAIIMQESSCLKKTNGPDIGLMQISSGTEEKPGTFEEVCLPQFDDINSVDDITGEEEEKVRNNIRCGIAIFQNKKSLFTYDSCEDVETCKNPKYPSTPNGAYDGVLCEEKACTYGFICPDGGEIYSKRYSRDSATVRAYNGWGCNSDTLTYVEEVMGNYTFLKSYVDSVSVVEYNPFTGTSSIPTTKGGSADDEITNREYGGIIITNPSEFGNYMRESDVGEIYYLKDLVSDKLGGDYKDKALDYAIEVVDSLDEEDLNAYLIYVSPVDEDKRGNDYTDWTLLDCQRDFNFLFFGENEMELLSINVRGDFRVTLKESCDF